MANIEKLVGSESRLELGQKINEIIEHGGSGIEKKITNCITEVPQRIKLELVDDVLTLKAGSVVTVPNGVGVFNEIEITSDRSITQKNNGRYFICAVSNGSSISTRHFDSCESGATRTMTKTYSLWYDTTNNVLYNYTTDATTAAGTMSLPVAIVTVSNGAITSIDQVFNGFGYIGSTVWVDKGVKGLISRGRNADGTLKNSEIITQTVLTRTFTNTGNYYLAINSAGNGFSLQKISNIYFDETNNKMIATSTGDSWFACIFATTELISGVISNFQPKLPFRAVDYNEYKQTVNEIKETTLNKSQITNCITEIPQRIKYDLTDGILTIKAGSVVIVPYGTENLTSQYLKGSTFINDNFKVYDTQFSDGKFFVWAELVNNTSYVSGIDAIGYERFVTIDITNNVIDTHINSVSGASPVATNNYTVSYDTNTNLVGWSKGNTNLLYNAVHTLPFMRVKSVANGYLMSSIDQVFNGFGYIGSTIWIDKGVKGLIPNGRNEDGSLNNIEITNIQFITQSYTSTKSHSNIILTDSEIGNSEQYYYDETENYVKRSDNEMKPKALIIGTNTLTSGVVSNFQPKQPFRAVDYNDIDGNWVLNNIYLTESVTFSNTAETSFSLANYLPNDGALYEVKFWIAGNTSNKAQYTYTMGFGREELIFSSTSNFSANFIGLARTRTLTISPTTLATGTNKMSIELVAYRKVR